MPELQGLADESHTFSGSLAFSFNIKKYTQKQANYSLDCA